MPFSFSINPSTFQSEQIATAEQQKQFMLKLSQLLVQITADLNQLAAQQGNAVNKDLGVLGGSATVDGTGATRIYVGLDLASTSRTLTINNVASGTEVMVYAKNISTFNFKLLINDPSSSAYTVLAYWVVSAGQPKTNMSTGWNGAAAGHDLFLVGTSLKVSGTLFVPMLALEG
jgi:hypothetical protein